MLWILSYNLNYFESFLLKDIKKGVIIIIIAFFFVNLCTNTERYLSNNGRKEALNRLKVVLVEQGKTSRWLAEQIGKSENTVSRWCANKV